MSICGIDFSSRAVDVVLLDEDSDAATWHRFELNGNDAFDRARGVREHVPGPYTTFWDDVLAVGIEDPRGYGAGSLYRVQGAILSCLPHFKLVHPLIPSHWRKTVGLAGNCTKEAVCAFASSRLWKATPEIAEAHARGFYVASPPWPQDAWDAYCIALATRTLLQHGQAAA